MLVIYSVMLIPALSFSCAQMNVKYNRLTKFSDVGLNSHSQDLVQENNEQSHNMKEDAPCCPTIGDLLRFGFPTLGSWLLQPILSLIDSSVVGMCSSLYELAALGPGIAWCDSSAYLFNFVGVATTSLYCTALANQDVDGAKQVLSEASIISVALGLVLALVQTTCARPVITLLCGGAEEAIPYAIAYSQIRAMAAPVAIPMITAQAAFLSQQDSITPLKSVLVGAVVNFVGDIILTKWLDMGLKGAAIATALSQYAGFIYIMYAVIRRISVSTPLSPQTDELAPEIDKRQLLLAKLKSSFVVPTFSGLKRFLTFCGPISFVLIVKSLLWTYTTVAASTGGVFELAAHQITINFFLFFAIFGDTMSMMSQTFLPRLYMRNSIFRPSPKMNSEIVIERSTNTSEGVMLLEQDVPVEGSYTSKIFKPVVRCSGIQRLAHYLKPGATIAGVEGDKLLLRSGKIAVIFAVLNSAFVKLLPLIASTYFTSSEEVLNILSSIVPFLMVAILMHGPMCVLEGSIIACKDLKFLVRSYLVGACGFLTYQNYARVNSLGNIGVWKGMAGYQIWRFVLFSVRTRSSIFRPKTFECQRQMVPPFKT